MAERKPKLRVVDTSPLPPDRPIMDAGTARRRFALYFGIKLLGLAALFGGVFLGREGMSVAPVALLVFGAVSLFVRPKMLGLTTRADPPR
ncbi:hypothetical protein GCM10007973_03560 [Polymorphobacter multimanifer]|uniref:Uncharacterized protein n=1 Tax=Polymorphobacter multimanifer TaxID=1070431 RepID=A0A841L6A8_9SPHN|nr:hypothetical protein [Polymorphobacter multimanifer]MBB6228137.1 hypothetical protein [Polymorphobacter multimanifer]GGI69829.1 hypothetical protein GCM10007973_03560 [Polymorphobacter multimanifer]